MNWKTLVILLILGLMPKTTQAQANCAGLTKAQCRFVTIVGTCSFGDGYFVQDGRVTVNGKLVGKVNSNGDIVDENGKIVTKINVIYQNQCRK